MTKLILVSATETEIQPALHFFEPYKTGSSKYLFGKMNIDVCITGVGMVNTAFALGQLTGRNYDMAINIGVAGSFKNFENGSVLNVIQDCFSELGAEDGDDFLTIDELGFGSQKIDPMNRIDSCTIDALPKVNAITVNKVHGSDPGIKKIVLSHDPDIESMEGAAFFMAANAYQWESVQLRAVSNKVERRNRNKWDLPLAIKNLNSTLIELIKDLNGM